jgi:hypothetical protein
MPFCRLKKPKVTILRSRNKNFAWPTLQLLCTVAPAAGRMHLSLDGFRLPNMIAFMKKLIRLPIFAAWFVLVILVPTLQGQTEEKMAKVQAVAQQLQLTPEQKVKVLPILEREAPKLEAIKKNDSLSGMQKMKQIRAVHAETAPELQQILSPAQYQKLQAIREERIKEAMAKKRAGR